MAKIFKHLDDVVVGNVAIIPPISLKYDAKSSPDIRYGSYGTLHDHRLTIVSQYSTGIDSDKEAEFRSKKALLSFLYGDVVCELNKIASLVASGNTISVLKSIDILINELTTP